MTKQELLAQKALYESHVAFKEGELRSFKDKLKSIESALQELEKGDQMDMFDEEHNYGDFSDSGLKVYDKETSMYHDLIVNEIDVMYELNGG